MKFHTFRRRHHCRLCGQIFCSRCCNEEFSGHQTGYTGICTYKKTYGSIIIMYRDDGAFLDWVGEVRVNDYNVKC